MTAGLYPAGVGPAGVAPVSTGTAYRVTRPAAIRYEGETKDWALDSTGGYRRVTPVEQGVILSLSVKKGDLKSSPEIGHTLHEIAYLGTPDVESDARDRLLRSKPLASYIADGSAAVKRIDVQSTENSLRARVFFVDLTGDPNKILSRDASISR